MEFFQNKNKIEDKQAVHLFNNKLNREAIILAGGFGTRLQSVVNDVPKPMAQVADLPFLVYLIKYLKHYNVNRVVLSVGYLAEKVVDYFKDEYLGISIIYSKEETPLGTGGGIKLALEKCNTDNVIVLNGDSFFEANITDLLGLHLLKKAKATLAIRQVENVGRYGEVILDKEQEITKFSEKSDKSEKGLINGGVYILAKNALKDFKIETKFSLENDFFQKQAGKQKIYGKQFEAFFIDIGVPTEYKKAQQIFKTFDY